MQIKTLANALALVLSSQFAHAAVLFDTRFASPPNIAGQPIVIDGTSATPSSINMGSVEMRVGFAGQAGNWAIFNAPSCGYDQIQFNLPPGNKQRFIEWDMVPSKLNNSLSNFSIHLDSTGYSARSIDVHGGSNTISFFNQGATPAAFALEDQRKYHVRARVDATNNFVEIWIDNTTFYKGSLGSSDITGVRFNLSPWNGAATNCNDATVALSNVLVYEDPADLNVPPPAAKVAVTFIPNGAAVPTIPANGGQLNFKRTVTNLDVLPLPMTTWIGTTLSDGTGFTLGGQQNATLAPATNLSIAYTSVPIPRWLPAGPYKARLSVVNINTNEITTRDIQFIKLP